MLPPQLRAVAPEALANASARFKRAVAAAQAALAREATRREPPRPSANGGGDGGDGGGDNAGARPAAKCAKHTPAAAPLASPRLAPAATTGDGGEAAGGGGAAVSLPSRGGVQVEVRSVDSTIWVRHASMAAAAQAAGVSHSGLSQYLRRSNGETRVPGVDPINGYLARFADGGDDDDSDDEDTAAGNRHDALAEEGAGAQALSPMQRAGAS